MGQFVFAGFALTLVFLGWHFIPESALTGYCQGMVYVSFFKALQMPQVIFLLRGTLSSYRWLSFFRADAGKKTGETVASGGMVRRASRLPGPWDTCSPFSIPLLCSLQSPTMTNGPALPGPSWRFALTELTVRRKAPLSYLPSGSEPPWPQPQPSPSRTQCCSHQFHSYSVSIQYQCCETFWVSCCAGFAPSTPNVSHPAFHWPAIHQSISVFIFLSQKMGEGV